MTATSELSMRAWNWNVTDSEKNIFDLIIQGQVLDMTVQRTILYGVKAVSDTVATIVPLLTTGSFQIFCETHDLDLLCFHRANTMKYGGGVLI